jgi:hypothetical protein
MVLHKYIYYYLFYQINPSQMAHFLPYFKTVLISKKFLANFNDLIHTELKSI